MRSRAITVIDQTIREGMQHRGIVFSQIERQTILDFQEELGVDICQAGYAPAHITEQEKIRYLNQIVQQRGYAVRVAAMGRASIHDVDALVSTGVTDFHLHAHIPSTAGEQQLQSALNKIKESVQALRKRVPSSKISIAVLDIGAFSTAISQAATPSSDLFQRTASFLMNDLGIDILSLPDTSGTMAPDSFHDAIKGVVSGSDLSSSISTTQISVHCHNDLGMASANTLMGVKAGATVVELSALGIGERNGIGDLFTVARLLKHQGYRIRLDTDNIESFRAYYQYVSDICKSQTQEPLLCYNTPFFGESARTHVAGTHAGSGFGLFRQREDKPGGENSLKDSDEIKEEYYLNVLCGRQLVRKYLESMAIPYLPDQLDIITEKIKSESATLGRRLEKEEIVQAASHAAAVGLKALC